MYCIMSVHIEDLKEGCHVWVAVGRTYHAATIQRIFNIGIQVKWKNKADIDLVDLSSIKLNKDGQRPRMQVVSYIGENFNVISNYIYYDL